jgi:hypothetical protein
MTDASKLRDASFDYYKTRLKHTLQHTQQSTKLIYLVNGAVLAALYFVAKMDELKGQKFHVIAFILWILAGVNFLHACLINRQGQWYRLLDTLLADAAETTRPDRPSGFPWLGTHALYAFVHYALGIILIAAGVLAWNAPRYLK